MHQKAKAPPRGAFFYWYDTHMFRDFFYRFPTNFIRCFRGVNLFWQMLAIGLTYACVVSSFDWWYFESTRGQFIFNLAFPSAVLGFFVPAFIPLSLYVYGVIKKSHVWKKVGAALVQTVILSSVVAAGYKAFTGRIPPELTALPGAPDLSTIFHFGFLRGGIFWGWPSSHTAVAFALSAALITLFPRRKSIVIPAALYALYIGLGVSVTIHWFSDFLAGMVIGTVIGVVVGSSFRDRTEH